MAIITAPLISRFQCVNHSYAVLQVPEEILKITLEPIKVIRGAFQRLTKHGLINSNF